MTATTATYKGRTYRVMFSGKTKFGTKAKLSFMDGSKEFWVDLSAVTLGGSSGNRGGSGGGYYCGYPCPVTNRKCCAANGPCHDCE